MTSKMPTRFNKQSFQQYAFVPVSEAFGIPNGRRTYCVLYLMPNGGIVKVGISANTLPMAVDIFCNRYNLLLKGHISRSGDFSHIQAVNGCGVQPFIEAVIARVGVN